MVGRRCWIRGGVELVVVVGVRVGWVRVRARVGVHVTVYEVVRWKSVVLQDGWQLFEQKPSQAQRHREEDTFMTSRCGSGGDQARSLFLPCVLSSNGPLQSTRRRRHAQHRSRHGPRWQPAASGSESDETSTTLTRREAGACGWVGGWKCQLWVGSIDSVDRSTRKRTKKRVQCVMSSGALPSLTTV